MCEILVRIKDRPGFDPTANALAARAGDVIAVCPDGWNWTQTELTSSEWLIVRIPGLAVDAVTPLVLSAFSVNPDGSRGPMMWKRARNFDTSDVNWRNLAKLSSPVTISLAQWTNFLNKVLVKAGAVTIGG